MTNPTQVSPALDELVAEYHQLREDDRYSSTVITSYLTGLVVLQAAIFAIYATDTYDSLPDMYKGLIPLVSFGLAGLYMNRAAGEVTRSYYLRSVEREIFRRNEAYLPDVSDGTPLPFPASVHIQHSVGKPKSHNWSLAILAAAGFLVFYGAVVATAAFGLSRMSSRNMTILFGSCYAVLLLILMRSGWMIGYAGRSMWKRSIAEVSAQMKDLPFADGPPRLLIYCLVPRLPELFSKAFSWQYAAW